VDTSRSSRSSSQVSYQDAATRTVPVNGVDFVYRQLGSDGGVPLVFLNHLAGETRNRPTCPPSPTRYW